MKRRSFISRFFGASIAIFFPWWSAYVTKKEARKLLSKITLGQDVLLILPEANGDGYVNVWKHGKITAYLFRDWAEFPVEQVIAWEKREYTNFWDGGNTPYPTWGRGSVSTMEVQVISVESHLSQAIHEQVFGHKMAKQMPAPTKSTLKIS